LRAATAARLVLGGVCLTRPSTIVGAIGGPDDDDEVVRTVARVLGGRLVLQGLADLALGPRIRFLDIAIELTHAASMLPVAVIWPEHRRSALVSTGAASSIGLLDIVSRTRHPEGG
jgi:hypothetical protein